MVDEKTIQHIARLARLKLEPGEAAIYGDQLTKVLSHFQKIAEIDTAGIEPLVTPSEIEVFFRSDEVVQEATVTEMLSNAPARAGNLFKVPPVI